MDPITQQTVLACAGAAGGAGGATYVDDVFSTFLWEGTGSAQTITNGLDLSGEGGLVWIKSRTQNANHSLYDTERGALKSSEANTSAAQSTGVSTGDLTAFNSNGFSIGTNYGQIVNTSGEDYCSWSFRKAPGFFDVVTYTGNGSNRAIAHNLGSKPGFMMIKNLTDNFTYWRTYHVSRGATKSIVLDQNFAENDFDQIFNDTEPTSTHFTVGTHNDTNGTDDNFVAYLFAHDDQSFGTDEDEAIIKCGQYTGTATSGLEVNLGFEPQFLIMRRVESTGDWYMFDNMRGWGVGDRNYLEANTPDTEAGPGYIVPTSTGFKVIATGTNWNANGQNYIYVAIRRPHKPPEAGTDVFKAINYYSGSNKLTTGFPVDLQIINGRTSSYTGYYVFDRLRGFSTNDTAGGQQLLAYYDSAETSNTDYPTYNDNTGVKPSSWLSNVSVTYHNFKRAPGFLDIVAYTGNGNGSRAIDHNLGVAPEMIITKNYSQSTRNWRVWHKDLNGGGSNAASYNLVLNEQDTQSSNSDIFGGSSNTLPTATQYTIGGNSNINENGEKHIAYLFASLDGISKVGTYSGSSNDVTVDCGFSGAPRYVIIKCLTRQEFFVVFDHARGIVSGDDPFFRYDFATAETNGDHIDPTSSGFVARGGQGDSFNAAGHTYVYLAIA